jgi:diadenosine tetraphosphatase ApaH/serine/threonine PP2A family protein phosphatase
MRYLILSDIHSNIEALNAVLRSVRRKRFDRVVVLGDLVGYGANPNKTVETIRRLKSLRIIRGNHDKVCSGLEAGELFNKVALESARWTREKLTEEHRGWLAALPQGPAHVDDTFTIAHGTPVDEDAYIFGEIEALNMFRFLELPICFFGHSHFPVVFGLDADSLTTHIPRSPRFRLKLSNHTRYLINPGSIGQPRDGDTRASFGIFDARHRTMTIRRVPYRYQLTQRKIRRAGLPALLADRLALGR